MPDKTTLVVTSEANPAQKDAMQAYIQQVMPLLLSLDGKVIKRSMLTDTYHGEQLFTYLLVMDFPSKQALVDMFESQAYQSIIPLRDKGFTKIDIFFAEDLT